MERLELSYRNAVPLKGIELKKILMEIKSGSRTWEEEYKASIVKSMVEHIGSTDSELRDKLIYSSFYQLIVEKNQIEHELLNELLELCLSDLLFKGIGENETDTVFTRSFTTLLIALILYRDNVDNFLSREMMLKIKDKLVDYIYLEKDLRGYISAKGWAHSIAHVSDAIDELVKSSKIDQKFYLELFKVLWNKVFVSTSVYIHDEDERILIPILEMVNNGLDQAEIITLIQNVPTELKIQKEQLAEEEYWLLYSNCKTFLKSFYIKVNMNCELIPLNKSIEKCLSEISLY
ncbi:Protein of unknown function [Psychrobacillus sp. OK028]|uniref:DUF2785 domain-containing protein n=1 Tax=Psychrobacillus sp. OK028 TaxID=1884359 RepID=UPI0008832EA8|nr:DUF2785 domain-containing protein [Psychrobacillus sp. OK028]SDN14925.1 Protein of unknown function [Psychrobacillus sp. OK028]